MVGEDDGSCCTSSVICVHVLIYMNLFNLKVLYKSNDITCMVSITFSVRKCFCNSFLFYLVMIVICSVL